MLAKKNKVNSKEIKDIFQKSRFLSSPNLTFRFVFNKNEAEPKIAFIAPKTSAPLAVERNLLKRRGFALVAEYLGNLPKGFVGAFVFSKSALSVFGLKNKHRKESIANLNKEIKDILNKVRF